MSSRNVRSIGGRLVFLVSTLVLAITLTSAVGYYSLVKSEKNLNDIVERSIPVVRSLAMIDMYHDGVRSIVYEIMVSFQSLKFSAIDSSIEGLAESHKNIEELFSTLKKALDTDEEKLRADKAQTEMFDYLNLALKLGEHAKKRENPMATLPAFEEKFKFLENYLEQYGDELEQRNQNFLLAATKEVAALKLVLVSIAVLAWICAVSLSMWVTRWVDRSLRAVTQDLSQAAEILAKNSAEVSSSSESLSSSSTQQSEALQETSSAIVEISSMVRKSSDVAQETEDSTKRSTDTAGAGVESVRRMKACMKAIDTTVGGVTDFMSETSEKISGILKIIQDIGNRTVVINDIVFQTKLLSFNAAVEAARAGEHGKGFAVVAEEVGTLARMSGEAAKEINLLLGSSLKNVQQIVSTTKERISSLTSSTQATVSEGVQVAEQCEQVLRELQDASKNSLEMAKSITQANLESTKGVEEISKSLQEIEQATNINTAAAQSCAMSSRSLYEQTKFLQKLSSDLSVLAGRREAASPGEFVDQATPGAGVKTVVMEDNMPRAA